MAERGIKHAGIIWIPATLLQSEKQLSAFIGSQYLRGADLRQMKGLILYLPNDGLRLKATKKYDSDPGELVASFPAIRDDFAWLLRGTGRA